MKNILYQSLCLIFVFTSCSHHQEVLPVQELKKRISINQLSDSSFFSDIRSIAFYKDDFFISEYNRNHIFILNHNLELKKTLGSKGQGPGELLGAGNLFLYRDSIFIINDGKRTIEVFDFNNHLETIRIPQNFSLTSDIRFCLYEKKIFLPKVLPTSSIAALSLDSDSVIEFGHLKKWDTQQETRIKNKRHLNLLGDKIIAIPDCQPNIEVYNMKGELLLNYNSRSIDLVDQFLKFAEKKERTPNSYSQLAQDTYIYGNQIFILIRSVDQNDNVQSNRIIQFELADNKIIPKQILHLGEGWFGYICVTEESILAYNQSSSELILYDYEAEFK